jgi:aminoglycoside phosphotransferase (APT) family kinase protein
VNTHGVELGADVVVKRFRSWDQDQHRREWRALTLLAEYAPGLAPTPVRADLEADPPTVTMSRLEGVPLTAPVTSGQLAGLAEALEAVQRAIPPHVLRDLPSRLLHPRDALRSLRAWCTRRPPPPDADPLVTRAFDAVADWVARPRLDDVFGAELPPVFGLGDGNLDNYLWDGSRVRIVDFEYSGRGDRAYELAEVVEHVSAWVDGAVAAPALLVHFALTAAESARLTECRRLLALFWFLSLLSEDPARPRNPPGTVVRQAERLLSLLD